MKEWRNFFLQRMGTTTSGSTYPVCESVQTWGIWCSEIPFKLAEKVKEPAKRSWYDEHGDDEYLSADGLYMEAYDMKVKLGCKKMQSTTDGGDSISAVNDVRQKVAAFVKYLRESGMMKLYSSYTRTGRQNVRLSSIGDNATWKSTEGQEFLVFEVTFKVCDPVTEIGANMNVVTS